MVKPVLKTPLINLDHLTKDNVAELALIYNRYVVYNWNILFAISHWNNFPVSPTTDNLTPCLHDESDSLEDIYNSNPYLEGIETVVLSHNMIPHENGKALDNLTYSHVLNRLELA